MKLAACCLCGSEQYRLYMSRVYCLDEQLFDLVQCRNCGLVRVNPMPDPETVKRLYDEAYFREDFSCGVRKGTYLDNEALRVTEYREILRELRRHKPEGRLLEVGCAAGSFLNYARRAGYEVVGVDVSEWASRTAREQFGLEVKVGRLVELELPDNSFDVVFCGDLLEHEPEPLVFLREVRRVLRPSGIAAIKVPTYVNSFYFRTARLIPGFILRSVLNLRLLRAMKLAHEAPKYPPYHLYEFSRPLLSRLCEKAGFVVLRHQTSLLVPEFLDAWNAPLFDRLTYYVFLAMKEVVMRFNLPAGHVLMIAEKRAGK